MFDHSEYFQHLVEGSRDGILIGRDGRLVFVNTAAVRLLGAASPEQLLGTPVDHVFHTPSRARVREALGQLPEEPARRFEESIVRPDGTVRDVEAVAAICDCDGPVIRLDLRDITERKRAQTALRDSEERLTLAFEGAREGVWDWNLETGAVFYSARWTQMLGYGADEVEPHVSAWERLVHPDDRERADRANESVARGAPTYEAEFRLRHKDGHYVHVLSRGFPVRREPGGPVVRIVGTHFDLTERKEVEDMLRRGQEKLELRVRDRTAELARANQSLRAEMIERERAERGRTELLGRLVFAQEDERRRIAREMHDQFGEVLTALSRRIEMLREGCGGSPELSAQVDALAALAQQLDRDVDHLVWELRPTALDDLGLRAALATYVQDWSKRVNIRVDLHTAGLLDDRLPRDVETTLYRIAQEALTNVARHSGAETVEVILERRSDHVLLIVEDDGAGFDPVATGTPDRGFGLLGMQERAALVGATLEIESSAGKGTTVLLRMAAAQPASTPAASPAADGHIADHA